MNHTMLDNVINSCQQTINTLYSVAHQIPDPRVQNKLSESAHHLRHTVEDCRFASQRLHHQDFSFKGQWGLGLGQPLWGAQPYQMYQPTVSPTPMQSQMQSPAFV